MLNVFKSLGGIWNVVGPLFVAVVVIPARNWLIAHAEKTAAVAAETRNVTLEDKAETAVKSVEQIAAAQVKAGFPALTSDEKESLAMKMLDAALTYAWPDDAKRAAILKWVYLKNSKVNEFLGPLVANADPSTAAVTAQPVKNATDIIDEKAAG